MSHSATAFSFSVTARSKSRYVRRSQISNRPLMNVAPSTDSCQSTSRRALLALIASCAALQIRRPAESVPIYDAMKTKRYVDLGRPPPDRKPPTFIDGQPVFPIDTLQAQDLTVGKGDAVKKGTLVVARWVTVLDNGSTLDDSNEAHPAVFRPGAHQVPPGVEDAVIGMRVGGVRRVYGTAERILT